MSTHETKTTDRSSQGFLAALRSWRPLILAALIPLAAACTDTVTGLEQVTHEEEGSTAEERPGATDIPVAR